MYVNQSIGLIERNSGCNKLFASIFVNISEDRRFSGVWSGAPTAFDESFFHRVSCRLNEALVSRPHAAPLLPLG